MREIHTDLIEETVARLCVEANLRLPDALRHRIEATALEEDTPLAREILGDLTRNLDAAQEMRLPICQDTGMAVVFAELGQDARVVGGSFEDMMSQFKQTSEDKISTLRRGGDTRYGAKRGGRK